MISDIILGVEADNNIFDFELTDEDMEKNVYQARKFEEHFEYALENYFAPQK